MDIIELKERVIEKIKEKFPDMKINTIDDYTLEITFNKAETQMYLGNLLHFVNNALVHEWDTLIDNFVSNLEMVKTEPKIDLSKLVLMVKPRSWFTLPKGKLLVVDEFLDCIVVVAQEDDRKFMYPSRTFFKDKKQEQEAIKSAFENTIGSLIRQGNTELAMGLAIIAKSKNINIDIRKYTTNHQNVF